MNIRIERKPTFSVCGKKAWITGQRDEGFEGFSNECNVSEFSQRLKEASSDPEGNVVQRLSLRERTCAPSRALPPKGATGEFA